MISMSSISSGLMSLNRDGSCPPVPCAVDSDELSTRMPSMISSGSFESEIELEPRMRMREPAPVSPADVWTTTPGTRELNASESVLMTALFKDALSIVAVGAPFSRLRSVWPVAVTVSTSSVVTAGDIAKSAVVFVPGVTTTTRACGPNPRRCAASCTLPAGTLMMR
jgi:hypothetical protein